MIKITLLFFLWTTGLGWYAIPVVLIMIYIDRRLPSILYGIMDPGSRID